MACPLAFTPPYNGDRAGGREPQRASPQAFAAAESLTSGICGREEPRFKPDHPEDHWRSRNVPQEHGGYAEDTRVEPSPKSLSGKHAAPLRIARRHLDGHPADSRITCKTQHELPHPSASSRCNQASTTHVGAPVPAKEPHTCGPWCLFGPRWARLTAPVRVVRSCRHSMLLVRESAACARTRTSALGQALTLALAPSPAPALTAAPVDDRHEPALASQSTAETMHMLVIFLRRENAGMCW